MGAAVFCKKMGLSEQKTLLDWSAFANLLFDDSCFLQYRVCAVFVDRLDRLSRDCKREVLLQLWHINALLLKVRILSDHASWVEFSSTNYV